MNRLFYFCLECNKGKKLIDKKSDEVYIQKLLDVYCNLDEIEIKYYHMHGKFNFKKSHKAVLKECKSLKKDNVIEDYEIILVLDKDNFTSDKRDSDFIDTVSEYEQANNVKVIWFTKDIEHVLLGARIKHNKTKEARQFKVTSETKAQLDTSLNCLVPNKDRTSNFLPVMNKLCKVTK